MTYDSTLTIKTEKQILLKAKAFFKDRWIDMSDAINNFLLASITKNEDWVMFTQLDENILWAEEKKSLDEMRALDPQEFIVSTNPHNAH